MVPRTPIKRGTVIGMYQMGLTAPQIAKRLNWPRATVHYTLKRYQTTGSSYNRPRMGRPKITSPSKQRLLMRDISSNPFEPWSFFSHRHNLSPSTIWRIAQKNGFNKCVARRKPFITEKARLARMVWAKENKEQDWTRVLWTDEASFMLGSFNNRRTYVIRRPGTAYHHSHIVPVFRTGRKSIMAWGCIGFNNKFDLHFFDEGSINSERYVKEILDGKMKAFVRRFKGASNAKVLVVEDNAPIHNSKISSAARARLGLSRLAHPPSSPDTNPIETMWHELRRLMSQELRATSIEMLKEQLQAAWRAIPLSFVNHLVARQERVRLAVLEAKGRQTPF